MPISAPNATTDAVNQAIGNLRIAWQAVNNFSQNTGLAVGPSLNTAYAAAKANYAIAYSALATLIAAGGYGFWEGNAHVVVMPRYGDTV
jgi:hypothetical protein